MNEKLSNEPKVKLTFMDLNADCQLMIFDQLVVYDLVSLVEADNRFFILTEKVAKQQLATNKLIFYHPFHDATPSSVSMEAFDDRIKMSHLPMISNLLRYFGHLIVHLEILNRKNLPIFQAQRLYQLVNLHCSETLRQLYIRNHQDDLFGEFRKPFRRLEFISLDGRFDSMPNLSIPFSELFPLLCGLNLESAIISQLNITGQTLPHLEYLSTENWGSINSMSIKALIKNNQQIRRLNLRLAQAFLLPYIADELPFIERLAFECDSSNTIIHQWLYSIYSDLHFKHLKSFIVPGYPYLMPKSITFGELEELEINVPNQDRDKLFALIEKYKTTLKRLRLWICLDDVNLLQFTTSDFNLIEMAFKCGRESDIDRFIELIENTQRLQTFSLIFKQMGVSYLAFNALQRRFSHEWTITEDDNEVHMERL